MLSLIAWIRLFGYIFIKVVLELVLSLSLFSLVFLINKFLLLEVGGGNWRCYQISFISAFKLLLFLYSSLLLFSLYTNTCCTTRSETVSQIQKCLDFELRVRKQFLKFKNVLIFDGRAAGVIIAVARECSSTCSQIYCRCIDRKENGYGQPFQLQKSKDRSYWTNEEVTNAGLEFGSILNYERKGERFLFQGSAGGRKQDVNKIQLDLEYGDSVYRGLKEAHTDKYTKCNRKPIEELDGRCHKGSNRGGRQSLSSKEVTMAMEPQPTPRHLSTQHRKPIYRYLAYLANRVVPFCKARIYLIGISSGIINNERVTLDTMDGEVLDMPLNCRESLVLSTAPVHLQLKRPWQVAEDDVGDVAVVKCDFFTGKPVCEGLILRYKPLVTSRDEEPVKIENGCGDMILVPGRVLFDTGNEAATAISRELLYTLNLEPDPSNPSRKREVSLAGGSVQQFDRVKILLMIRGYQFKVRALFGALAKGTDLLVGMDIIQQLYDLNFTIGE